MDLPVMDLAMSSGHEAAGMLRRSWCAGLSFADGLTIDSYCRAALILALGTRIQETSNVLTKLIATATMAAILPAAAAAAVTPPPSPECKL
jgi:hypothetical protein